MGRLITLILVGLFLVGCADTVRIRTEVQESFVPVMYCPAPETYIRPVLAINQMTEAQRSSPGELANHYQATIEQLLGYAKQLELELEKYDSANEAYEDLRLQTEDKFINGGVVTPESLPDQNQLGL